MKNAQDTPHFLVIFEVLALVLVLVLCISQPTEKISENDSESSNTVNENNIENQENSQSVADKNDTQDSWQSAFSEDILKQVAAMSLEQKVAQMFVLTPESLTGADKVTLTGSTTQNALKEYPIGGLVYSAINFQNEDQIESMLNSMQQYCTNELDNPIFLMVEERGGRNGSPVATVNQYNIEPSASKIGETADVQEAIDAAKAISSYLKESGFNMNLAPNADLAAGVNADYDNTTYSSSSSLAAMMVAETVSTYGQKEILTVMSMFPGASHGTFMSKSLEDWEESEALVYKAGMNAGVNAIMVGNIYASAFTGQDTVLCCMSEEVVAYLRDEMEYTGILISDSLSKEIITSNYTSADAAVAVISAGMDMVYCPEDFKEAYHGVLDAVAEGIISEEQIDEAVARILTCKKLL